MSAGSKHVTSVGSARIMTRLVGVPNAVAAGLFRRGIRVGIEERVDVGEPKADAGLCSSISIDIIAI